MYRTLFVGRLWITNAIIMVYVRVRVLGRVHNAGSRSGDIMQFLLLFPRFLCVYRVCIYFYFCTFSTEKTIRLARRSRQPAARRFAGGGVVRKLRIHNTVIIKSLYRPVFRGKKKPNFHLRPPDRSSVVSPPPKRVYNCTVFACARGVDDLQRGEGRGREIDEKTH